MLEQKYKNIERIPIDNLLFNSQLCVLLFGKNIKFLECKDKGFPWA